MMGRIERCTQLPQSAMPLLRRLSESLEAEALRAACGSNGVETDVRLFERGVEAVAANGGRGEAVAEVRILGEDGSMLGTLAAINRSGRDIAPGDIRLLDAGAAAVAAIAEKEELKRELGRLRQRTGLERLLSDMSYEVRTPLNGIMLMEELLRSTDLTEEQRKYIEVIQLSSKSLLAFINERLNPESASPDIE